MTTSHRAPESSTLDDYRYRRHGAVELYLGDAAHVLAAMPDDSVDTLVTSPFFGFAGLRHGPLGRR
jgi:hypothetical protein